MEIKLQESERKVMEVLWKEGDLPARAIAQCLEAQVGWNVNTTYTLIKRCIAKGAIARTEPHFQCHALLARDEVQRSAARELIDKVFDGAADQLFAALLSRESLSRDEIARLKALVEQLDDGQ
ncbi:MAG: BlaI/MecI/CopY family transcriptional regulator [Butyricicoccaceae bacterium]